MSALTPDEEAELATLSRALFARNAQPDARARERYTELHARTRGSAPAHRTETTHTARAVPEPSLATREWVPEPSHETREAVPEPPAHTPAAAMRSYESPAAGSATEASDPYAAIPGFGELILEAGEAYASSVARESRDRHERATVESVSSITVSETPARVPPAAAKTSWAVRIVSASVGFVVAAVAVIGVQWAMEPRPVVSGTAVKIDVDDIPELGSIMTGVVRDAAIVGDATISQVDGVPGVSIVVVEYSAQNVCAYLWARDSQTQDAGIGWCKDGQGPIVIDYSDDNLRGGSSAPRAGTSERYRLILRDEQMTLWRNPPTDRENY